MGREMMLHFVETMRDSSSHGATSGSIGMLFVVLVIIIVLGLVAGVIARVCGGRHFAGLGEYDFEGWVEHKCASCIDGSLPPPPPPPPPPLSHPPAPPAKDDAKPAEEAKATEEKKEEDRGEKKEEVSTPAPTN